MIACSSGGMFSRAKVLAFRGDGGFGVVIRLRVPSRRREATRVPTNNIDSLCRVSRGGTYAMNMCTSIPRGRAVGLVICSKTMTSLGSDRRGRRMCFSTAILRMGGGSVGMGYSRSFSDNVPISRRFSMAAGEMRDNRLPSLGTNSRVHVMFSNVVGRDCPLRLKGIFTVCLLSRGKGI